MLEGLVKIVFWIINAVANVIMLPLTLVIDNLLPDVSNFIITIETWLDTNIWPIVHFVKQCMINIGIPQICFTFVITYYTLITGLWVGSRLFIFGYNVYQHFKP